MLDELKDAGCINCPVSECNATYRGSRCFVYRARAGVDFDPQTNYDRFINADQNELRNTLIDYFYQWAGCSDSYIYDLTRTKSAFAVGTMSFEDFIPWNEDRIAELVDEFIAWLKETVDQK